MIVDVRTTGGERLGRVEVDPTTRPVRVRPDHAERDLFLDWDGAVDDAGHLRTCVMCDQGRLYRSRTLPQVTPFVILLAFAGATLGLLGYADRPAILALLVVLLMIDIGMLVVGRTRLVCYRCGSLYNHLPIARYHKRWDPGVADRDREPPSSSTMEPER